MVTGEHSDFWNKAPIYLEKFEPEESGMSFKFVAEYPLLDPDNGPLTFGTLERSDRDMAKLNFATNGKYLYFSEGTEVGFWEIESGKMFSVYRLRKDDDVNNYAKLKICFDP